MLNRLSRILALLLQWYPRKHSELRSTAWLDGLRGVASFQVLVYHYVDRWIEPEWGFGASDDHRQFFRLPFVRSFYDSGRAMVCTFFVISGFVLTQRSLRLLRSKQYEAVFVTLSSAIFRRFLRLFPPAIFPMIMGFILVRLGLRGETENLEKVYLPHYEGFWLQAHHWLSETTRYFSVFSWYGRSFGGDLMHKYEAVIWTLPMEFFCSMCIYVIVMFTGRLKYKIRRATALVIAVYSIIQGCWAVTCFCYGLFLADLMLQDDSGRAKFSVSQGRLQKMAWSAVLFMGFWIAGAPQRGLYEEHTQALGFNFVWALLPEHYVTLDVNYTLWTIAGLLITTSISQLDWAKSALETPFCQYLGKISFSLYLNHVWIRDLMGPRMQWHVLATLTGSGWWFGLSWIVWMLLIVPMNFCIAGWFEKLVDAPVVRFAHTCENYCMSLGQEASVTDSISMQDDTLPLFQAPDEGAADGVTESFQMVEKSV